MTFKDYLLLFGGMGLVTYLPRALPLLYLAVGLKVGAELASLLSNLAQTESES